MFSKDDQETLRFFQLPKNLYENPIYKEVSNGAKIMYAILRDRQDLSVFNNWVDDDGFIFFYYDGDSLSDYLNVSRTTIQKYKKELINYGLMYQKRQGQGKPNMMYILKPESVDIALMNNNCTSSSAKTVSLKVQKLPTNETYIKDTEYNNTEYLHHLLDDGLSLFKILEEYSLKTFGKKLRNHKGIYELDTYNYMDKDMFIEMLEDNITKYDNCNLDYLEVIQERFK